MSCRSLTCCNIQFHSSTTTLSPSSISFSNGISLRSSTSTSKLRAKFEKFQGEPEPESPSSSSLETIITQDKDETDRYLCYYFTIFIPSILVIFIWNLFVLFQLFTSRLGGCSDTIKSGYCFICIFRRDESHCMFQSNISFFFHFHSIFNHLYYRLNF